MRANPLRWLRTWWLTVPEPREISMIFTAIYSVAGAWGVLSLVSPPEAIEHIASTAIIAAVSCFLIAGAIISGCGGYRDYWELERLGLAVLAAALACYGILLAALQPASLGSKIGYFALLAIVALTLTLRWVMIRGFTYRPRG